MQSSSLLVFFILGLAAVVLAEKCPAGRVNDSCDAICPCRDGLFCDAKFKCRPRRAFGADQSLVLMARTTSSKTPSNSLGNSKALHTNEFLASNDGRFKLVMQSDGHLVEYFNGKPFWWSNTHGHNLHLVMQSDGNLVMYRPGGIPVWASHSHSSRCPCSAVLQDDGHFVIYDSHNKLVWATGKHVVAQPAPVRKDPSDILGNSKALLTNEFLVSKDKRFKLVMQSDGHLVEYFNGKPFWWSNTHGQNLHLVMQSDGNLVMYRPGGIPVWASHTHSSHCPCSAVLQNDGHFVIYDSRNIPVWATHKYLVEPVKAPAPKPTPIDTSPVKPGPGTFVGSDGRTLCKYCPVPCGSYEIFNVDGSTTCTKHTYLYGCDIKSTCVTVDTATRAEANAAIVMCIAYNGCKLAPKYKTPQRLVEYVDRKLNAADPNYQGNAHISGDDGTGKTKCDFQRSIAFRGYIFLDPNLLPHDRLRKAFLGYSCAGPATIFSFMRVQAVRDAVTAGMTFSDFDAKQAHFENIPKQIRQSWRIHPVSESEWNSISNIVKQKKLTQSEIFMDRINEHATNMRNYITEFNKLADKGHERTFADYQRMDDLFFKYFSLRQVYDIELYSLSNHGTFHKQDSNFSPNIGSWLGPWFLDTLVHYGVQKARLMWNDGSAVFGNMQISNAEWKHLKQIYSSNEASKFTVNGHEYTRVTNAAFETWWLIGRSNNGEYILFKTFKHGSLVLTSRSHDLNRLLNHLTMFIRQNLLERHF